MHSSACLSFSPESLSFLEPIVSSLTHSFSLLKFFYLFILVSKMGYSHLLNTEASLTNFKATYNVFEDVEVAYCHEGNIALEQCL